MYGEEDMGSADARGMRENRRHRRAHFDAWVEMRIGRRTRRVTAFDLSERGIGVRLEPPVPEVKTPVASEFALPGIRLPLVIDGVVAWSDAGSRRAGIHFVDVDPALAELLESYVAGRL